MIGNFINTDIKKNKKIYMGICIAFFLGVIFGVFCINHIDNNILSKFESYFNDFQTSIINIEGTNIGNIFVNSLFSKIKYIGIIFLLACTIIGCPIIYFLVMYKGFSLSYVISGILRIYGIKRGIVFALTTLLVQNIIYIPSIIFFSVYSINFCKKIKNRDVDIKMLLLKFVMFFFILLIISALASTAELLISFKILKKINIFFKNALLFHIILI